MKDVAMAVAVAHLSATIIVTAPEVSLRKEAFTHHNLLQLTPYTYILPFEAILFCFKERSMVIGYFISCALQETRISCWYKNQMWVLHAFSFKSFLG